MNNEAFRNGYDSHTKGQGFLDNPHDSYSDEGRRWIDGYVKSMQDQRAIADAPKCATCSALFVRIGDGYAPACACHVKETRNVSMD